MIHEFGTNHIYNCDTFNEMSPSSGDLDYLRNIGDAVYKSMTAVDPDAVWYVYNSNILTNIPTFVLFLVTYMRIFCSITHKLLFLIFQLIYSLWFLLPTPCFFKGKSFSPIRVTPKM